MVPVLILVSFFTMAYQANKPCDDACFARKIQQEMKPSKKHIPKEDNSWRYRNELRNICVGGRGIE